MTGMPKGWAEATLGDLGNWSSGGTPSRSQPEYYSGDIPWVKTGDLDDNILFDTPEKISAAGLRDSSAKLFPAGTLLVAMYGATIGKTALLGIAASTNQACAAFVPTGLSTELVPFLWKFVLGHKTDFIAAGQGGAQPNISQTLIKQFPIKLPPLPEQKRIVAKLDSLSAKSARARTELARIETLVSRYKQAVLSKAFSGELIGLAPAPTEKPHTSCWDLPSGWRWVAFAEAVEIASKLVNPNTVPELPHIAPDNIESGTARLLPFRTIREDGVISAKHRFYAGQILYSKIRPYLRKAVIADFDGACSADMYPLSPRGGLTPRYLLRWLVGEQFTHFAIEHQGRTVLPKINQAALNNTPLPLPPLAAQHEIVRRIEFAFDKIDRVAKEARRALELLGRLDETILDKAFRGELVLQDEEDEPAELLLARIRAGRETALKEKKRVMKRTSAMVTASEFLNAKLPSWPLDGISFQDLREEFHGSYDDLKTAVFTLLSDANSPLKQVFDDTRLTMTLRKREK